MTPEIVKFEETPLHLTADLAHDWVTPDADVAVLYGVAREQIRKAKSRHHDELLEGTHWVSQEFMTPGGAQRMVCWTRLGVITLGFFLKSQRAKQARAWAATVALQRVSSAGDTLPQSFDLAGVLPRILNVLDAMERRLRVVETARSPLPRETAGESLSLPAGTPAGDPFANGDPWFLTHELVQRAAQAIAGQTGEPVGTTAMKLWSEAKRLAGLQRMGLRTIPPKQLPLLRAEVQRLVLRAKEDWPDLDLGAVGLGTLN